jgi:hypothetical protein
MAERISAEVRAANFKQLTRRNWQNLGSKTIAATGGSAIFELPRARLLAGCRIIIDATATAVESSSTAVTPADLAPYSLVKKILLNLNNGFAPVELTGQAAYIVNSTIKGVNNAAAAISGRGNAVLGLLSAASSGVANKLHLVIDVPNELNPRDPVGLILLQNVDTLANLEIQTGVIGDVYPASSGFTFTLSTVTVTVMTDTYSIPADPAAVPDISILKSYKGRTEAIQAGENIIKLPVGQTYRKLWFTIRNSSAVRLGDANITSPIELVLDQNETPYKVAPAFLAAANATAYNGALPDGMYVFDFSDNGIPNLGNSRDLIDTQRITEFWLRFTSNTAGTVEYGYELLSRLAGM